MNPVTNVFPLIVVLTVSMVKEAAEDHKRRKKDAQVLHDHMSADAEPCRCEALYQCVWMLVLCSSCHVRLHCKDDSKRLHIPHAGYQVVMVSRASHRSTVAS